MIWMVVFVDAGADGTVAGLVETSFVAVGAGFGLGVACSAFAFFAGAPFKTGSFACCTFLFAMLKDLRWRRARDLSRCRATVQQRMLRGRFPNFWLIGAGCCYLILSALQSKITICLRPKKVIFASGGKSSEWKATIFLAL